MNPGLMANEPVYSVEGRDYQVKLLDKLVTGNGFNAVIVNGPDTGKTTIVSTDKLAFAGNCIVPLWNMLSRL